jgi:hypothetical protein
VVCSITLSLPAARQYNQPAALPFNLDFGSELLRVKGFASRGLVSLITEVFYVYLLHSIADDGFYIGYTTDLKRRLSEHNTALHLQQSVADLGS